MLRIEPMQPADWPAVRAIYLEGVATGNATFETRAPEWERWDSGHLPEPRLVARLDGESDGDREGEIAGWAALSPVSARAVYAGVAEVSLYVGQRFRGRGVGRALLQALVEASEARGIWTLQAGIFPENRGSLRVHEQCGFRVVGVRERLGQRDGVWRDVVLMERRSQVFR